MTNNVVAVWIVSGLSTVAFLLLFKYLVSYMPDTGVFGAIKAVVNTI